MLPKIMYTCTFANSDTPMKHFLALSCVFAAACSDEGLKKYNSNPEATITSHVNGDTTQEGVIETIRGQVGDPNHSISDPVSYTHLTLPTIYSV